MSIGIALVDDHLIFRESLKTLLDTQADITVVAEASDGKEILERYDTARPDVIVMDVSLAGMDGITATRELLARDPQVKILILSGHAVHDYVTRSFAAGALGYALKSQSATSVIEGVKAVAAGQQYLAPELPPTLLAPTRSRRKASPGQLEGLSHREREIFDLVVRGYSNASISEELSISVKTVETHRANINRKLSVHSSTQLLRFAALRGLVSE
jgi:DNA-binding NarL/FixJ family response regulator